MEWNEKDKLNELLEILDEWLDDEFGTDGEGGYEGSSDCIYNELYYKKFDLNSGASKMCCWSENSNWVVKVGFTGSWYIPEEEDENGDWYMDYENMRFDPFNYMVDGADYMESEFNLYNSYKGLGLQAFFPVTEFLGVYGGRPVYIQERVTEIGYLPKDKKGFVSENSKKVLRSTPCIPGFEHMKYDIERYPEWFERVLEFYGERLYYKLIFIGEMYKLWNDFHSGNFGYRANGEPVIIDFSGFND